MDLPTPREVELETLLRQRDVQLAQITDEITHLRQYVLSKPQDPPADAVSLPPALTALLLPHLNPTSKGANASSSGSGSSSTAALTQRLRLLQEENDDLYQLLKQGETGKLKEEVRALRRLVERLEGALRESHQVVHSLSTELEKSYEAILTTAPRAESPTTSNHHKSHSRSPRNSYHVPLPNNSNGTTASSSSSKLPPTGPRAHKKPRLSSPPPAGSSSANNRHHHSSSSSSSRPGADTRSAQTSPHRERGKAGATANNHHAPTPPARMELDEQPQARGGKEREKEYHKDMRHRDRERREERERDGGAGRRDRRSAGGGGGRGGGAGGGGGGGRRGAQAPATAQVIASSSSSGSASASTAAAGHQGQGGDRTLKERMGL